MKNTEALKSLGATHVLDRNLAEDALVAEVRKITSKPIKFAFDSISSRETQNTSYKLIASGGALLIDNYPEIENVVADKRLAHVLANGNYAGDPRSERKPIPEDLRPLERWQHQGEY